MSDDKLFKDDDFDEDFDLTELDGLYTGDEDFGSFEDLEYVAEDDETTAADRSERRWLIIGISAIVFAVLLRLLLTPVLDTQNLRADKADEIIRQIELSNASAIQALTAVGNYDLFRQNIDNATSGIGEIVSTQSVTETVASQLFANGSLNTQLVNSWDTFAVTSNSFLGKETVVNPLKSKLTRLAKDIRDTSTTSISFVEAVSTEGRSKQRTIEKDNYLFLTSEAADISGTLSRLSSGMGSYFDPSENLQRLSDTQNTLVVRLNDTLGRITGNAAAVVATAAEPLQARFDIIEAGLLDLMKLHHH